MTAKDGQVCMIFRKPPRIVAKACIGCRLSLNACQAGREYQREACCEECSAGVDGAVPWSR